ncbi:MAG TPA: GNAT family N-acetyltransferase [Sedimentibacter sp.]|nr:GNAT family N-acetyltransferase [Sedimentibacter sp.]HOH69543.1 GNAT family N-acetyltransferase [Sedimentibacter sp.]HPW99256.1 GNAT family N-acetyltransferase [Sedimentibacter sp.]
MEVKKGKNKFYIGIEEAPLAEIIFSINEEGIIVAESTKVSEELGGKGAGKLILKELVDWARKENRKIKPLCPFIIAQMEKNSEYHDMLA